MLLFGRCIVRFQRDYLEVRLPRFAQNGDEIPSWVLADRLAGVLALWGAELVTDQTKEAWWVVRGHVALRCSEGLQVPYQEPLPEMS